MNTKNYIIEKLKDTYDSDSEIDSEIKQSEDYIKIAIHVLKQRYGVSGINDMYLTAVDIDGDLRIAPMGVLDKMLWDAGGINTNNFVKVKDLIIIYNRVANYKENCAKGE